MLCRRFITMIFGLSAIQSPAFAEAGWANKLTDEGIRAIRSEADVAAHAGVQLADSSANFARSAVKKIMDSPNLYIRTEALPSFTMIDAMDHYFYSLADRGFFKSLEDAGRNAGDYIQRTLKQTAAGLNAEGACFGGSCSGAYKIPSQVDDNYALAYLDRIRRELFRDASLQAKLPNSLRHAQASQAAALTSTATKVTLEDLFTCSKH